ncbi:hypothetical protein [Leifsonia sp. RAF41]|uniref:hypothetical protein n=1 Tax=Leifsonia sp. RAF41 TaxID=3233056 RepID=UPI003F9E85B1
MAASVDPVRDELVRELRQFRKGSGEPTAARLGGLFYLTEALGDGIPARAFDELAVYRRDLGADPTSAIGAFFYLSGWGIGLDSVDQRRSRYRDEFFTDVSTAWRRSQRGISQLVSLIRDRDEQARPWAFVSVFQSGSRFQPVLDFNLRYESWTPPLVFVDGSPVEVNFHLHPHPTVADMYTHRMVLPESPLNINVSFGERMAVLRVAWSMPVWPVWSVLSWTADPLIMTHLRTFRERAVEVSLQWWGRSRPDPEVGLVTDGAIWADRAEPGRMNLPDGWTLSGPAGRGV